MENAELARQTEVKLRETETLLSVSRTFSSTLDLQALLRHFLRRITQAVDADSAGVWLRDGDGEWLQPRARHRPPPRPPAGARRGPPSPRPGPLLAGGAGPQQTPGPA